ncbi:MAG: restriction endonuclease [Chloroflexi bacterium HGW-Chloroflexi-5]|jgi:hypothetical protein|nr:MAG: restriction endonuclease [Chloroflexi bacterium HGW-Chloroflexi-5]
MIKGHLSSYFQGIAAKRLSAVETDPNTSHQHEFNGVNQLISMFGEDRNRYESRFIFFGGEEGDTVIDDGFVTWYDARENHPTRSEFRLYYGSNFAIDLAKEGDTLVIAKTLKDTLLVLVIRSGSTMEQQVQWLFNISINPDSETFLVQEVQKENDPDINYASRLILSEIGIEIEEFDENFLDPMLQRFDGKFPKTSIFSAYSRSTLRGISALDEPDLVLIQWMEREELLFRTLERHLVSQQLTKHFPDIESFISFSLSVQNRRKSRAGYALENHLKEIFMLHEITFTQNPETENKATPDFIFPGIAQYRSTAFPNDHLTMLGVKSTCKDRWRQVLAEANRIEYKHLLTLEPGISENQTDEMKAKNLQLVIPKSIHDSFKPRQIEKLLDLKSFINLVKSRQ